MKRAEEKGDDVERNQGRAGRGARGGIGLYLDCGFSPDLQVFGLSE